MKWFSTYCTFWLEFSNWLVRSKELGKKVGKGKSAFLDKLVAGGFWQLLVKISHKEPKTCTKSSLVIAVVTKQMLDCL